MTQDVGCIIDAEIGCSESGSLDHAFTVHWLIVLGPRYCRHRLNRVSRAGNVQTLAEVPKNDVGRSDRDMRWFYTSQRVYIINGCTNYYYYCGTFDVIYRYLELRGVRRKRLISFLEVLNWNLKRTA